MMAYLEVVVDDDVLILSFNFSFSSLLQKTK
jgi:hypothetical protein